MGDAVVVMAPDALRSHLVVDVDRVGRRPASLGDDAAVGLPTAFLSAILGLERFAGLRRGERVLVLAGASEVGRAAIQIAVSTGVFAAPMISGTMKTIITMLSRIGAKAAAENFPSALSTAA